jgi:hypothetical protein
MTMIRVMKILSGSTKVLADTENNDDAPPQDENCSISVHAEGHHKRKKAKEEDAQTAVERQTEIASGD